MGWLISVVQRDICLEAVSILLNVSQAEQFCTTAGGNLAKIINDDEVDAVEPGL